MVAPTEATRFGCDALDADDRDAPGVGRHRWEHLGCQYLLDFRVQRGFADTGWPEDENQGVDRTS